MKRSSNAMMSSLLWTHSLCSVESSCCSALAASTPDPSPKLCPHKHMFSDPWNGFSQTRSSQALLSKAAGVRAGQSIEAVLVITASISLDLPWSPACGVVLVLVVALNTQHTMRDVELDGMLPPSSSRGVPPCDAGSICIGFSIGSVYIGVCMAFVGGGWWSCTLPPP